MAEQPEKKPVFVAEDDFDMRSYLRDLLQEGGYAVFTFVYPKDLIEVLLSRDAPVFFHATDRPVIVTDIYSPGLNGWDILYTVKSKRLDIPVIFITAMGNEPGRKQALSKGAFDYLQKPFKAQDFLLSVERAGIYSPCLA